MNRLRCWAILFCRRQAARGAALAAALSFETETTRTGSTPDDVETWSWCGACGRVHPAWADCVDDDEMAGSSVRLFLSTYSDDEEFTRFATAAHLTFHEAHKRGALAAAVRAADLRDARLPKDAAGHIKDPFDR